MYLLVLLSVVSATFQEIVYGDFKGPVTINPPLSWQVSTIQLNSNHKSDFDTLYVLFNPMYYIIDITKYYSEIQLPGDDDPSPCTIAPILPEINDWALVCPYSVEEAGTYGPITLTLRFIEDGQIFGQSTTAGYFTVLDDEPEAEDDSITITHLQENENQYVLQPTDLNLTFTLSQGQRINAGDYLILNKDVSFLPGEDDFELHMGDSQREFEGLQFDYDEESMDLYIFGLTESIEGTDGGNTIWIIMKNVYNPWYETDGGDYSWTLKVMRYGTPTVLYSYKGSGPTQTVTSNNITVVSWEVINEKLNSYMVNGLLAFTELVFEADDVIPEDGSIVVSVSGANFCGKKHSTTSKQVTDSGDGSGDSDECSLLAEDDNGNQIDCAVADSGDNSVVTCTLSTGIPPNTQIFIRALTSVKSSSPSVTSILTRDGDDRTMNSLKESFTPAPDAATLLTVNQLYVTESYNDIDGVNQLGATGKYGVVFSFNAPVDLIIGDTIKVYLPISTASTRNKDTISLTTDYYGLYKIASGLDFTATTSLDSSSTATAGKVSISTGSITFTLEAAVTSGYGVVFYVGASSKASPGYIFLPTKPTTVTDFSEASVVLTKSGITYIYSKPFYIDTNENDIDFTILPFCDDVFFNGLPVEVTIVPQFDYKIGSIEAVVSFSQNFTEVTDLVTGGLYPTVGQEVSLNSDGDLLIELASLTKDTEITFTIAYPAFTVSETVTATLSVYVIIDSSRELAFSKTSSFAGDATESTYTTSTGTATLQTDSTHTFTLAAADHDASGASTTSTVRYAYVLPQGFTFSGADLNELGSGFQYYSYMAGYSSKSVSETASTDFSIVVNGPWYEYSSTQTILFAIASGESFSDSNCISAYKKTITVGSALGMTYKSFDPQSQKSFTLEESYIELVLTLSVSKNIMPSSFLTFEIGGDWSDSYVSALAYTSVGGTLLGGEYKSTGVWQSETITKKSTGNIEVHAWVKLPKLTSTDGSVSYVGFKSVSITYSGGDSDVTSFEWTQATDDTDAKVLTKFSVGSYTPKVSDAEVWAFPDVAGSTGVYLGVEFKAPYDIAKGSSIEIDAGFDDDSLAADNTWLNYGHSSAAVSDGVLTLTVMLDIPKGSVIQVVKDSAFDLDAAGFHEVLVKLSYDDDYIIDDSDVDTDDDEQGFTVKDAPEITVTDDSAYITIPNAGFSSYYSFSLEFSAPIEGSNYIVFDLNKDFNAQAGSTFTLEFLPGLYYIAGYLFNAQEEAEFLLCRTEHWMITCLLPDEAQQNAYLTVVLHLTNPSTLSYCSIYLMDWEENLTVAPFYYTSSEAFTMQQSFSGSIDLLYALAGNMESDRGLTHTMTLVARLDLEVSASGSFVAIFPSPFNLDLTDPSTTKCKVIYDDGSSRDGALLSSETNCEIDGNLVIFDVDPDIEEGLQLSAQYPTRFMIAGVITPKDGYQRDMFDYEGPEPESVYYTQSFSVAYATNTMVDEHEVSTIDSISMGNLNAAFTYFERTHYEELEINHGEKLIVAAGCFVGIFVIHPKGEGLFAKEMEITGIPRGQAPLILSEGGVYRIRPENPEAEFLVGAPSTATPGYYYIDWKIREDSFGRESFYAPPPPTIVEINTDMTYPLMASLDIIVPPGYKSFPYPLEIDGGDFVVHPFEEIEVRFSHNYEGIDLKFYPEIIFMDDRRNFATLSMECMNCTIDSVYEFSAEISGPSADTFRVDQNYKFVFRQPYQNSPVIKLDVANTTSNSFEITLYSDSLAVVTWALAGELSFNEEIMTEQYIMENAQGFGKLEDNKTSFDDKFDEYSEYLFDLQANASSYEEFALIATTIGRSIYLMKQDFILANEVKTIASFYELVPSSNFKFYIYVNNFCGEPSVLEILDLQTQAMPPHAMIEVDDITDEDNFTQSVVALFKIDSNRVKKRPPPPGRGLSTSNSVFLYSSMTSTSSGYDQVSGYTESELSSELGVTVTSITKISTDTYPDGDWETEPLWITDNEIVTLNFTSTVDGSLVCEIETNPNTENYTITTAQVLYGLDRTGAENNDTDYSLDVTAGVLESYSFNFSMYAENVYVISCVVCNDYPLTPECSNVTSEEYSSVASTSYAAFFMVSLTYFLV